MHDLYHNMKRQLCSALDEGEATAVAFWLLEEVAGLTRSDVLMGRADELGSDTENRLQAMTQRIAQGEPVQYVLGHADFCGLRIGVAPGVLIPRPETEELVGMCNSLSPSRILDLCTGSGCIALALKNRFPQASVEGWDLSDEALHIARQNTEALGLDVCFRKVDVLGHPSPDETEQGEKVSLLVSNPPYVCESERADMEERVLGHEPSMALFVPDDDALLFYRAIARWGQKLLCDGGRVVVEINRRYGSEVATLFREQGYSEVEVRQDQFGNDRMVMAQFEDFKTKKYRR